MKKLKGNTRVGLRDKLKRLDKLEKEVTTLTAILLFGWLLYELGFYE